MKRTIAKEFLLLVGCIVVVLPVALFGWGRNTWLNDCIGNIERERLAHAHVGDSLWNRGWEVRSTESQALLAAVVAEREKENKLIQELADMRRRVWTEAKIWAVVKWAAFILLALVYPLRFLVLGTRWAISTLRA